MHRLRPWNVDVRRPLFFCPSLALPFVTGRNFPRHLPPRRLPKMRTSKGGGGPEGGCEVEEGVGEIWGSRIFHGS